MDLSKLTRVCTKCLSDKPLSDFHKKGGRLQPLCKVCKSEYNKDYRSRNSEKLRDKQKQYYEENSEAIKEKQRLWAKDNKEVIKKRNKNYREKYPHKATEHNVRLKKSRKQSVPKWLSKEQKSEIQGFYWLAKDLSLITGERYEVDHIVPIKGKNVCGLHVPWNLQILPKDLNLEKRNKWTPDHD